MRINKPRLSSLIEIGRRALAAQQLNMSVTGNNIANVNTVGYTRQDVVLESGTPLQAQDLNIESGVLAGTTRRARDTFYDIQLRNENPSYSRWEQERHELSQIENVLNEPNEFAISNLMDEFFNSWEDLALDPTSQASRTIVTSAGQTLANTFNRIGDDFAILTKELDDSILDKMAEANYHIKEIADTTYNILNETTNDSVLSTLMDRRDVALDKLSKLMDISYVEKDNGDLLVYSNGIIVCEGKDYNQMYAEDISGTKYHNLKWVNEKRDVQINNGSMKGLLNVRDNVIPEMEEKLNILVQKFVEEVNLVHNSNYDLEGNAGCDFFDAAGLDINTMNLDSTLLSNTKFIAISNQAGSTGNADGAFDMVDLKREMKMNDSSETFKEFYLGIVISHGSYTNEAGRLEEMEKNFVNFLENKKNEISQVDLDEELSNMIQFQQAYRAAAKIITNADSMFSTLIGLV